MQNGRGTFWRDQTSYKTGKRLLSSCMHTIAGIFENGKALRYLDQDWQTVADASYTASREMGGPVSPSRMADHRI